MAVFAISAEKPIMRIVLSMAGITCRRKLDGLIACVQPVAEMACKLLMRTCEGIVRLPIMIEAPESPAIGIMTFRAIVPETLLVIAVFMTG